MKAWNFRLVCILIMTAVTARGQEPKPVYETPALAARDPDFFVQGEYAGQIGRDGDRRSVGVQVIAKGKGGFHAVVYDGGLPGAGGDGQHKKGLDGRRRGSQVVFGDAAAEGWLAKDGWLRRIADGSAADLLPMICRKSPTLGLKPPAGAMILFDGTTTAKLDNGRMDAEKLLIQGTTSKQKFGDHILHIEFRLPYQPEDEGQGRANSGAYLQGRYEIQMLDSFGLEGKRWECGGIYDTADAKLNMCFPPLSWQTYDVKFSAARFTADGRKVTNARMTVYHNGVLIHEDVEIPRTTTAAPITNEHGPGPLYLQNHGCPARYRNVWVLEFAENAAPSLSEVLHIPSTRREETDVMQRNRSGSIRTPTTLQSEGKK